MWVDYQWLDKAVQNKICADFPLSLHNVSYTVFLEVTISIWANLTRGVACSMQSQNPLRDAQAPVRGFVVFGCVSLSGFKQDQCRKRKPACKDKTNNPKKVFVHAVFQVVQAAFHVIQTIFDAGQSLGDLLN